MDSIWIGKLYIDKNIEVSFNLIREAKKGLKPSRNPGFPTVVTEAQGAKKWPRKTEVEAETEASVQHYS